MNPEVEQPTTGQDPSGAPATQAQTAPTVQVLDGPWAKDITATFADPSIAVQVHDFLRSRVQPYVTGLETKVAENNNASELIADLQSDPAATYLALGEALYGEDAGAAIRGALPSVYGEVETPEAATTPEQAAPVRDPEVQALIDERRAQKEREQYEANLKPILEQDPTVDETLIAPFIVAADGDVEAGYKGFQAWRESMGEKLGVPKVDPDAVPDSPAVLGSEATSPSAPPVQKQYASLDEAMDDFLAEQRAGAPAPVGSV